MACTEYGLLPYRKYQIYQYFNDTIYIYINREREREGDHDDGKTYIKAETLSSNTC